MIDPDGFRPNVGIILSAGDGRVLWAKRIGQNSWQFPQGGIKDGESDEQALFRELEEELGLLPEHVEVVGRTRGWLKYRLPKRFIRRHQTPVCIGQKQKWFVLKLVAPEAKVRFDRSDQPEFDGWRWVDYWEPISEVVFFKRDVYRRALQELSPLVAGVKRSLAPEPQRNESGERPHSRNRFMRRGVGRRGTTAKSR